MKVKGCTYCKKGGCTAIAKRSSPFVSPCKACDGGHGGECFAATCALPFTVLFYGLVPAAAAVLLAGLIAAVVLGRRRGGVCGPRERRFDWRLEAGGRGFSRAPGHVSYGDLVDDEPVDAGYRDTHDALREKYRRKRQLAANKGKRYVSVLQVQSGSESD